MRDNEKANRELLEKIENFEIEIKNLKKKLCPYPGCDSLKNFKSSLSQKHYSLDSCPKFQKVKYS